MYKEILNEVSVFLEKSFYIDSNVNLLINLIESANNIFITGAGRSGLVGRFFAMRLFHCGFFVYIVGDTTTPPISENDLLIAITASGETGSVLNICKKAKRKCQDIVVITSNIERSQPSSIIDDIPGCNIIYIGDKETRPNNKMPMGTKFEISTLIFLESVIATIIEKYSIKEEVMRTRHANLE